MKTALRILVLVCFSFLGFACKNGKEEIEKNDPTRPRIAAIHVVKLLRVQFGAEDFNLSTFGNPLKIEVTIREDGKTIRSNQPDFVILDGTRGERTNRSNIQWTVNFDPTRNYQVVLEEKAIIANVLRWSLPATPKIGYWPIGVNKGKLNFGRDSYIEFSDKIAQ